MTTLDWATVLAAVGEAQTGDRTSGRDRLFSCWTQTTPGDHAYRCVLAHYLADLQDWLDDEVAWDRTALEEQAHLRGDALAAVGTPDVAGWRRACTSTSATAAFGRVGWARRRSSFGRGRPLSTASRMTGTAGWFATD